MINTQDRIVPKSAQASMVRPAVVAGRFYPADPTQLRRTVRRFLDAVQVEPFAHVRALIAPHAGYSCSGAVAGHSFKTLIALPPASYTIYLMGPAHWVPVGGVGLTHVDGFETPLGVAPVALDRVEQLLALAGGYKLVEAAHIPEHCLEVELPFLQTVLTDWRVVPMLFDEDAEPERVANDLAPILSADPRSLVVVSSDLSHYHAYVEAIELDSAFLAALATGDIADLRPRQACGIQPILTLTHLAQRLGWSAHVLAYANSGDTCGPKNQVVGYGAAVYTA